MINLSKYNIKINKIEKYNDYAIINNKYLYKNKKDSNESLYKYFDSINYNYNKQINDYTDNYELYYYKDFNIIDSMNLLHSKTLSYEEINIEELANEIDNLMKYYLKLQDMIEEIEYPRIDYMYMIENISMFYKILNKSKYYLDKCIDLKSIRKCLIINTYNNHFINYDNCCEDILIKDYVCLYKNNIVFDLNDIKDEIYLFYYFICIPNRLEFNKDYYTNIKVIEKELNYINRTLIFLEEYEKDQETD